MNKTVFVKCGMNSYQLDIELKTQKTRVTLLSDSGKEFVGEFDSPMEFADSVEDKGYGSLVREQLKRSGL